MEVNQAETDQLIQLFRKNFINVYRIIFFLDQKEGDFFKSRNIHYHQEKHKHHDHSTHSHEPTSCCGTQFFSKIYIPQNERTPIEKIAYDLLGSKYSLQNSLPELLDFLGQQFQNIKKKGVQDKLVWNDEAEQYLAAEVMKQGVQAFFASKIQNLMQKEQSIDSKQPMLLATPKTWENMFPSIPLDFLPGDAIKELHQKNYTCIPNFGQDLDFGRRLYKQLNLLEIDGRFQESIEPSTVRNDQVLWVGLSEINQIDFPNFKVLIQMLTGIPYQLNKKTGIISQISQQAQVSCFNQNQAFHSPHFDSSFEKEKDNGRTLTCLYCCNSDSDLQTQTGTINIVNEQKEILHAYQAISDSLIILKSRLIPYEILHPEMNTKRFIVRYWVTGPSDREQKQF